MLPELRDVPQEVRRQLLNILAARVKPSELGLVLPSPSPKYLLQSYVYQLYRLLDTCNLADRDAIKNPPSAARLHGDKQDFMMELFEESLLRTLASWSHNCLHYYGGEPVELDLADNAKSRLTATLREAAEDRCKIGGPDAGLLSITMLLPKGFNMHVKRGERPDDSLKVIEIKSKYCSLKIKMISY